MSDKLKIEKNVPIPISGKSTELTTLMRAMNVGDSIFIPNGKQNSISANGRNVLGAGNFTTRTVNGGVRVWRIK